MAASINLLFLLLIAFSFTYITSESLPEPEPEPLHFSLENILDQLKSHISLLESRIDDGTGELRIKDEKIKQMEKIIHEKSKSIDSLQSEIESLQPKGAVDVKEQSGKSYARIGELEKQVDKLRNELESQSQEKDAVEIRAYVAEKKNKELSLKLETLQMVNDKQKIRTHKIEHARQVAQEETKRLKFEADSGPNKLINQVDGEWLPHWLAVHFSNFQYYVVTHWNEHGRQALEMTVQKVLEKKSQFDKWAEHHFETIYIEAKKFTQPYINQVAKIARPHFDKIRVVLKPYTRRMLRACKQFSKSTTVYHHQVEKMLKNNELTRSLATMELAWFAASALLTLPVIFTFKLYSTIFRKKAKKHRHSSHINHSRRGAKRSHAAR